MEQKITINCVIGIDPGANGGIAVFVIDTNGNFVRVAKMPKDITELRDFLAYYKENYKPIVFIEKLSVRPDDVSVQGDRAAMGKLFRIQKLMANYEHLKALIEMAEIPFVMVHPMSWQTKLKLRQRNTGGVSESKAERKRRYQAHATELYPQVKVTLWNSDALLLMHFGRWALLNDVKWIKANLPVREHDKLF